MKKTLLSLITIILAFNLIGWEQKNEVPEPLKVLYPFSLNIHFDSAYNLIKAELPSHKDLLKYDEEQWRVTLSDSLKLTFMALKPGEVEVPAIQVIAFDDLGADTLYTEPFMVTVTAITDIHSLLTDIKPLRGVKKPILLELKQHWLFTLLKYLLIISLVAGVTYLIYRYREMIKKFIMKNRLAEETIVQSPWEYALQKLSQFESDKLLEEGEEYPFAIEMSLLIRRFLARYYEILAAEKTTYELQEDFKSLEIKDKEEIIKFLKKLDQVKYTKGKIVQGFSSSAIAGWFEHYLLEIKSLEEKRLETEKESK